MKRRLLLAFIASLLLTACSKPTISKEEALTILKKEFKEDCTQELSKAFHVSNKNYNKLLRELGKLEKQGYLEIQQSRYYVSYSPAHKAKDYEISSRIYRIATARVQDIVAIAHNQDGTVTVRFSYNYETLPLFPIRKNGSLFNNYRKDRDCNIELQEGEVVFKKFDTGWKIQ